MVPNLSSNDTSRWDGLRRFLASPWLIWGVVTLGILVRLRQYLFAPSYWYDEAFLVLAIRDRSFAELLGPQPYNLVIPPLYLWMTHGLYLLAGDAEWVLRLPAFVADIAALLMMVPLARLVVGKAYALWPVAFLATARMAITHGCEVRPYSIDLLLTEIILFTVVYLVDRNTSPVGKRWAGVGLGAVAFLGPWLSFPSAFVLGAASAALAVSFLLNPPGAGEPPASGVRSPLKLWFAFNGAVALSGFALWWFSARYMYYSGMTEHWGYRGWWGFPNWSDPGNIALWLVKRPEEIGNYGSRGIGVVLSLFAILGAVVLARRAKSLPILFVGPMVLAVCAALMGKYPLAGRTLFFLVPCMWLLATSGFAQIVAWGRQRRWELAPIGFALVACDLFWVGVRLVNPDPLIDYRGAYQYVHAHEQAGDAVWAQAGVVYQVYYGKNAEFLSDDDMPTAERLIKEHRIWVIAGTLSAKWRHHLEAAGGELVDDHEIHQGLHVLLFAPHTDRLAASR